MTTLDERYQKGIETRTKFGGGTLTETMEVGPRDTDRPGNVGDRIRLLQRLRAAAIEPLSHLIA